MAKWAHDDVMDALLEAIAAADRLFVCNDQPATYAEASADMMLAEQTLTPGDGNGDFTLDDGDSSGRKATVAAQVIASADATGTANHVALADSANSKLLYVTTTPSSYSVTSGQPVNVDEFDITVPDPT